MTIENIKFYWANRYCFFLINIQVLCKLYLKKSSIICVKNQYDLGGMRWLKIRRLLIIENLRI